MITGLFAVQVKVLLEMEQSIVPVVPADLVTVAETG
jgi:hypothetical protein